MQAPLDLVRFGRIYAPSENFKSNLYMNFPIPRVYILSATITGLFITLTGCQTTPVVKIDPSAKFGATKVYWRTHFGRGGYPNEHLQGDLIAIDGIRLPYQDETVATYLSPGWHTFTLLDWKKITHRRYLGYTTGSSTTVPGGYATLTVTHSKPQYGEWLGDELVEKTFQGEVPAAKETNWETIEDRAARAGYYTSALLEHAGPARIAKFRSGSPNW